MRAGQLRQRITIQSKTPNRDTFGQEVITWTDFATVWAAVEPLRGREFLDARMVTAEVTTKIRIRQRDGISPEMRVVFGSINYDVLAVIHVEEREREIHLMCQEII
jgi:SPP1 family predicted phage head-tail adaptor